ncbi:hypothetical protein WBG78_15730 [Chryseolinea sp. T2]
MDNRPCKLRGDEPHVEMDVLVAPCCKQHAGSLWEINSIDGW